MIEWLDLSQALASVKRKQQLLPELLRMGKDRQKQPRSGSAVGSLMTLCKALEQGGERLWVYPLQGA